MRKRKGSFLLLLLLLYISSFTISSSSNSNKTHLQRGQSLSVEDQNSNFLTSPDTTFTCGFHNPHGTNAFWFSIWFTHSLNRTVVWTANRNTPVNGKGSTLTLQKNGAMVLRDVDGTLVWETNTTSADVNEAHLLDTGNLVLKNQKGDILWQSFDYPTDTILPSQTLTKSTRLISVLRKDSFESGYFSLGFVSNNVLMLIYDGPEISSLYWPSPDFANVWQAGRTNYNSSRFAVFDDSGSFSSSDGLHFSASDAGFGIRRRLTMDYDGNLRVYSLNNSTGLWYVSWQAMAQPCNVHGICGRNGICVYSADSEAKCICPPGYESSDPSDLTRGCKPVFDTKCVNSTRFRFVELPNTDYYGFDLVYQPSLTSFDTCRDLCLGDCLCAAFSYRLTGEGVCFTKTSLFNGYRSPNFQGSIYLKLPMGYMETSEVLKAGGLNSGCGAPTVVMVGSPAMYQSTGKKVKWVYLYSFAIAIGVLEALVVLLGWWLFYGKHGFLANIEDGYRMISSQFRGFSYAELKAATNNFKVELGRGGSGAVYKGVLEDERAVAVKRLGGSLSQGEGEFWAEVSTIGIINHMNLVRMWGFCSEKEHRLLVYEFVENLSLDKRLFTADYLGWKERFKVALGTAKGLAYLHHECLEWVIHCDVKPENILLDANFEPKIADFGLAKLSRRGGPGSELTRIRGTKGYMAPEWALNLPITAKVDVYGYGVVVLEMVKGVRLSNWVVEDGEEEEESELMRFVRVTKRKIQCDEESWIEETVDPRLEGLFSRKQAAKMVEIGIMCVEEDRTKRPTMDCVVQALLDCEAA